MEAETLERPLTTEQPATAITLPPETRAVIALNSSKTELDLRALATKHVSIVEIKDRAGREQAHGAAMELMRARTDIEKASKAARDDATKFSKAVIAEEKRLVAIVGQEEKRLKDLRDQWDAAEAAEKAERERIAAEKKLVVDNAMTWIRNHAIQAVGKSAADIKELMSSLETMEVTLETFADRAGEAEQCRLMTLEVLAGLHAAVAKQEAAAAQVEAERIRLEQARQEQAAAAKAAEEEVARAAAEAKATAKAIADAHQARLDEQRRAFMQEQADARAKQAALAEQEEARRKALDAEIAAFEAEKAAKLAAEQKATAQPEPAFLEPVAGVAEILDVSGDVEYIALSGPSDADVIYVAARAVSLEFGLTIGEAIHRLAAVESWTQGAAA